MTEKWTLVQHSGYSYGHDPGFKAGLELRSVLRKAEQQKILKAGGLLFDSYQEAEEMSEKLMYPEGYDGIYPRFRGTFSEYQIDGSPVAIPVREIVA